MTIQPTPQLARDIIADPRECKWLRNAAELYLDNLADGYDEPCEFAELLAAEDEDEGESGLVNFGAAHPDSPSYLRECGA